MKKPLICLFAFTFLLAAEIFAQNPTILSFTPTSTCQGKSIPVFITGANLIGATAVKVGGGAVDSFKVNDSTSITAYISHGTAGKITVTTSKSTATSSSLFSFSIGHSARAYIADDSLILVIDVPADTIITSIDLGYNWPSNITAAPDGTKIYFSNYNGIGVVNTVTHVFKNYQISISNPMRMDISPDGTKLYVVSFNSPVGSLSVINTSNFQLIKKIPLGSFPGPLSVSADGNRIIVYNNSSNSVSIINAQNNTVVATLPIYSTLNGSGGICMSPDGTKAYVIGGDIVVIDLINNAIIRTIPAGNTPGDICISPDGQKLYLVDLFDNAIKIINTKSFAVTSVSSGIPNPYSVTLSPDGKQLFVCGNNCNGLAVINTSTNSLKKIISFPHNTMYSRPWGRFIANLPEVCPLPKPVIISFKTPGSTGTKDTIRGKAFTGATAVSFGGVAASSFTVADDSTIVAVVGTGASGFVKVTTSGGSDSLGGFKYINNLPISLTSLIAVAKNNSIRIEWQTAAELNTSNFIIEHSIDERSFKNIDTVKAIGSGANSYSFIDVKPINGINYYRLQCADKGGSNSFSKLVSANFGNKSTFYIIPNPAKDFTTIYFNDSVGNATIEVYDLTGKAIIKKLVNRSTSYKLNTQSLPNGVYLIKVNTAIGNYIEKLLINK